MNKLRVMDTDQFTVISERAPNLDDEEIQRRLAQVYRIILEAGQRTREQASTEHGRSDSSECPATGDALTANLEAYIHGCTETSS
jgi:hypothetical protein